MTTTQKTIRFYWRCSTRYRRYLIPELTMVPFTVLINQFLPPLILANVLNRLSKGDFVKHNIWASFGPELILYIILVLAGGVIAWRLVDHFSWKLEANIERDIAQIVFKHLLSQSAIFHANRFGGSLVSQTNKLLSSYIRIADTTVYNVLPLLWSLVFISIFLAGRAPLFVVAFLVFAIFYMVTAIFVTRKVRRLGAEHAAAESKQTGYLSDAVSNVMAIKSFAGMESEIQRFAKITENTEKKLYEFIRAFRNQLNYFSGVTSAISGLSLTMAVVSVVIFDANLATVFLILNYTASIVNQLFQFSNNALRNYNRSFGDAADMVEILQIEPEIKDPEEPEKSKIHRGEIRFNGVTFSHEGADGHIFNDLNLHIKPGEKIGLVGQSGSGKTTLTRILLRFSDVDSGEILIDSQNIARITQDDLHRAIAYVPQEPLLFHRSLQDNIAYGDPSASIKAVKAAAKQAHADGFIEQLPDKYKTLVGERGVKLSGGQRQRVAIARAMLKNAPILVLDEATSALDSESEALIQDALWKLMEGRTAIVIAHRLSTIQKMDRIIVLDNGEIIEQGTHAELIHQNGTYASLWARQSGGFMEE